MAKGELVIGGDTAVATQSLVNAVTYMGGSVTSMSPSRPVEFKISRSGNLGGFGAPCIGLGRFAMNRITTGLAIAIASVSMLLSGSALAQDFSGHWGCQYGYAEYTAQGYLRGHTREFNLALYTNGGFEAAGHISSGAGVEAFQAQGQWRYNSQSNEIEAQGQSYGQSGTQAFFAFGGVVLSNGRGFQNNIEMPDSMGRYVAQRLSVLCQR